MRIVVNSNTSLQPQSSSQTQSNVRPSNSILNIPVSNSSFAPRLRATAVRPIAPLHASTPYSRNVASADSSNRVLISHAKSLLDVTNAEPLFYVGASGNLLCRCCVDCTGFSIPQNVTMTSRTNPNRQVLTQEWRNFKKSLRNHLALPSHLSESSAYYQRQGQRAVYTRADTEAGLNLVRMVYENVITGRSYNAFSTSCAARFMEGTNIGFQNHSAQFAPAIVDCSYDVLKGSLTNYLTKQTPFGTALPFGISADKDTSKRRSRQVTGLRYPSFDENYNLPFILTSYVGHPSCERFTGAYLGQKISEQLQTFGINVSHFSNGFTGSSYDGQYLNLKVNDHLKLINGLNHANGTLELWDGAHIVDLIYKKAVKCSPAIGTIMSVVHNVTKMLKNDIFEDYLAMCRSMGAEMRLPKTPKDLKFIKHGLLQMEDFTKMKAVTVATLRKVATSGTGNVTTSAKLKARCSAFLTQLLQPSFDLILSFVIDLVRLLASFSLQFQQKHLFVNHYFNLVQMLQELLTNIDLSHDISFMAVDQRFVFRSFCRAAQASPAAAPLAVQRCMRFVKLLKDNTTWFWYHHYYWKVETMTLLPECAGLLNHLMDNLTEDKQSFITGGKELCIDCQRFLSESEQDNHDPNCQSQVYLTVPSLLPSFRKKVTVDLEPLKKFLPSQLHHHLTTSSISELKNQLVAVKGVLEQMKLPVTMDSISKYFFMNRHHWDKCMQGVLLIYLKLLVIPATEAFMETLGSIMEKLHERFKNQDPGLDDKRLTKEMFLKMNGPPLILSDPFLRKVLATYRSTGSRTFAHEPTTLARLPISSLTIQRIRREAHNDINRISCLEFD